MIYCFMSLNYHFASQKICDGEVAEGSVPGPVCQPAGGTAVADLVAVGAGGEAGHHGPTVGTYTADCRDGAQPAGTLLNVRRSR